MLGKMSLYVRGEGFHRSELLPSSVALVGGQPTFQFDMKMSQPLFLFAP